MKTIVSLLGVVSLAATSAYAWGATGHETVGYIAMQFLAPKALSFVQSSLGSEYDESLGPAAPWADDVRSEKAYSWSAPYHFVDAEDDPPTSCSVVESRDCPDNDCILGAIANYTTRVVETSLSATQRQEALKFLGASPSEMFPKIRLSDFENCLAILLDHFLGDITQPLHVEALEVGGNDIDAICSGSKTNLHAVWDSGIINKLIAANYSNSATTWANALATRIKSGNFKSEASDWIACSSTSEPLSDIVQDISNLLSKRAITPLECPLLWAQDSNALDCSTVFTFTSGEDLCTGSYYTNNVPVIETQIAKGGYRLAAWLNVLFDGATNLP